MSNSTHTLNQIIEDGTRKNLLHNYTQDKQFEAQGNVTINEETLINFGSCSYLGLEDNFKLKEGVIEAVIKYGTQFSSSRTYLSLGLYHDLECSLQQIFNKPLIVTASTTLGHLAAIPIVVEENDVVIVDLQAHSSMQMTIQLLKAKKIPIYIIKHNCMESLEKKIQALNNKFNKIWYFADGVYSMYGDFAPFKKIESLLNKYKKFHLYIDDAHGMGWTGDKGSGVVRDNMLHHDKMILAVSLNKSFGAAGGCIVFPNKIMEEKVRNCGSTYIFCGPIQPPMLGAANASAKLHLSDKFHERQNELHKLISYTNQRLDELDLPQFMKTNSPLFFIPVGLPKITSDIITLMREDGFYINPASFPAVPMKKSGLRFMINSRLNKEQIDKMLMCLQTNYVKILIKSGSSCAKVSKNFNIPEFNISTVTPKEIVDELNWQLNHSILEENKKEWNTYFSNNGNLDYDNIKLLEQAFSNNDLKENNWQFYYLTVKDQNNTVVLKTFYTTAITKDDMFSPSYVSKKVEQERITNPYHLTSKNVMTGSLTTKGNHIYLNKIHVDWKAALKILVHKMQDTLHESGATKFMLRDFYGKQDLDFETYLLELGLIKHPLLNNMVINDLSWNTTDDFLKKLGQKYRYNVRKEILKYEPQFEVDYSKPQTHSEIEACYALYESVYNKALELNVFKLPFIFFKAMCTNPNYDFITLYIKPNDIDDDTIIKPVLAGILFSYINDSIYNALIVGLDYQYIHSHNTYKQILYKSLLRAKTLKCLTLDLGYTAELEKKKLGAKPQDVYAYVQATEHYNFNVLEAMY